MYQYRNRKKQEGKKRKYLRALALMLCACMTVTACPGMQGTISAQAAEGQDGGRASASAASGKSEYMYYSNEEDTANFNVKGIDNGRELWTTFVDQGYRTASSVEDGNKIAWNSASGVAMGGSLIGSRQISLVYGGRYAMIRYIVENKGSETRSFQIGSSADVMIDDNDYAPVVGTANGLSMSGEPKNSYIYNLVAPTADTLWYGFYGEAYANIFNDLADKTTPYEKDSGMAWSWSGTAAPGQRWSRYVLLGVGELPPAPKAPVLTNKDPEMVAGSTTNFTGTAEPGNTVCIEVNGEEYSAVADSSGKFTVPVTPPLDTPAGDTPITYYAVSPEGGISDIGQTTGTVIVKPAIILTDTSAAIMEDSAVDDAWYKSFIQASSGTVTYTKNVNTAAPGTYTVTYTSKLTGYANATAKLTVTVLPLPLELADVAAARVSGKDSFTLSATLKYTGGETVSESGFVWGIMRNPTLEMNNGTKKTASVIKTKNGKLSVTADQIADGVNYYMRPYVKTTAGNTYYGEQESFSINGKSYGTFTIKNNNNNTFTVTRTGGTDGTQKVYFRTVNGSAVGGTHFTHQASSVTFAEGETSKTITVSEIGVSTKYGSKTTTQYTSADRTYQVEIYRVDGGGALGTTTSATRTMAKSSSYTIDRTIYTSEKSKVNVSATSGTNGKLVADGTTKQGAEKYNVNFCTNRDNTQNYNTSTVLSDYYTDTQRAYLSETAAGWYYRYDLLAYEKTDGYEHAYMGTATVPDKYYDCGKENPVSGLNGQLWACTFLQGEKDSAKHYLFPSTRTGGGENSGYPLKSSGSTTDYNGKTYVGLGLSQTCYLYFGANGADSDVWYVDGLTGYALVYDTVEPQLIGAAPVAGTYKAGDKITISLIFDEIVDSQYSDLSKVSADTSWGTFTYEGGADTNVLYFTGTVPESATGTLKINSITNSASIKDMCNATSTKASGGTAGSISVSVDHKKPTVAISNTSLTNQTAKATVTATNADTLRYAWSQSTVMPAVGWFTCSSGQTVTNRQASGTWYLHVMGTYNATGTTAHTYQSFNFGSSSAGTMPDLTLSVDNTNWAKSRTITLTKAPSAATVTVKTPSGGTASVTGTSYTATANGRYTFTLTSGTETVMKSVTVSKIDRTAPAAAVEGPADLAQSENVKLSVTPSDAGGSGVKSVTGTWTRTTNGGSASTVTATLTKNSDGTYTAVTPGTAGNSYTYRLNVTVTDNAGNTKTVSSDTYTVNLKAPTITVTKKSSSNKGDTYTYTVNAQGNEITAVQLPDDTLTTALSGTFTITSPGTYYATASDAAGHVARSSAMTVAAGVDGDAPEVRLYQKEQDWTKGPAVIDVSIYEKSSIKSVVWKKDGGTQKTLAYAAEPGYTAVYGGTFSAPENGDYTVTVTDANGNVGTAKITVSNIDITAPQAECRINATPNAKSGWYTDSSVPVILSFTDPAADENGASGIASVKYKWVTDKTAPASGLTSLTASQIAGGSVTCSLTSLGSWYLYYQVTDKVGNVTEGFSDVIKKDHYTGGASFTRPTEGQPVSQGLTSTISLSYGPSGGYLKAGLSTSLTQIASLEPHTATGTKSIKASYTATVSGTHYFRIYPYARNGETGTTSYAWSFYVRQVDFNTQGGSSVESQLVWTTLASSSTSTTVQCRVVEPAAPTRTGYTFGGWYTDAKCSAGSEFDFANTQVKKNTTLYAKWTANTYNVAYHLTDADGTAYTPADTVKKYTYGQGLTLPVPSSVKEGFTFYGWYSNAAYTGTAQKSIAATAVGDKEYYAYFKDTQAPVISSIQCAGIQDGDDGWVRASDNNNTPVIRAECRDNEAVTGTWIKADSGGFSTAGIVSPAAGSYEYALREGEHTYTFKAADAAGNAAATEALKVKYDGTVPVIGEIVCEDKVTDFMGWSIGRKSMVIHIPVTDSLSGVKKLTYTETRTTAAGETEETKTVELSGKPGTQTVDLELDADWKGRIRDIICTDVAGNISAAKAVGVNGDIIVENDPPVITVTEADLTDAAGPKPGNTVSENFYEQDAAPTLYVSVQDQGTDAAGISSGIESIIYTISGEEKTVSGSLGEKLTDRHGFIIPLAGRSGVLGIVIKAADHAGNTTVQNVTVKIKGPEKTPEAVADYPRDVLTRLTPEAVYKIKVPAGEGGTVHEVTADADGTIPLKWTDGDTVTDLCGKTIGIVKKGDGTNTTDSEEQTLVIAARPAALPEDAIKTEPEIAKDAEDAVVRITIDVGPGTDDSVREYSTDGGKTWTDVPDDDIIRNLASGDVIIRDKAEEDRPHGEETTITIEASATTITAAFDLNYEGAGVSAPSSQTGLSYKAALTEPVEPVREGYDFVGWFMEPSCQRSWNFTGGGKIS